MVPCEKLDDNIPNDTRGYSRLAELPQPDNDRKYNVRVAIAVWLSCRTDVIPRSHEGRGEGLWSQFTAVTPSGARFEQFSRYAAIFNSPNRRTCLQCRNNSYPPVNKCAATLSAT